MKWPKVIRDWATEDIIVSTGTRTLNTDGEYVNASTFETKAKVEVSDSLTDVGEKGSTKENIIVYIFDHLEGLDTTSIIEYKGAQYKVSSYEVFVGPDREFLHSKIIASK